MTNMKFKNAFEKACNADTLPEIMHDGILTFHMTTVLDKNNDLSIDTNVYEYKNKRYPIITHLTLHKTKKGAEICGTL